MDFRIDTWFLACFISSSLNSTCDRSHGFMGKSHDSHMMLTRFFLNAMTRRALKVCNSVEEHSEKIMLYTTGYIMYSIYMIVPCFPVSESFSNLTLDDCWRASACTPVCVCVRVCVCMCVCTHASMNRLAQDLPHIHSPPAHLCSLF